MRTISKEGLAKILGDHRTWRSSGGSSGARADLADANLADANLADANLADANLAHADLARANLARANLARAYLADANLAHADLADANLADANLADANLADANLADANLAHANLARANLARAYLAHANLARANLADAYLARANLAHANLAHADLADAYLAHANLAHANLADAYLADAYLADAKNVPVIPPTTEAIAEPQPRQTREDWEAKRAKTATERAKRYRERHPDVPVVENLDAKILAAIESGQGQLGMSNWHGDDSLDDKGEACGTTHCRAGWAIHLAGKAGYALEERFGPAIAGRMIYQASTGRVPYFYASYASALADIKHCATEQKTTP